MAKSQAKKTVKLPVPSEDLLKEREIGFVALHPNPEQARSAMAVLAKMEAVQQVELLDAHTLRIRYSIVDITLEIIEAALGELGFHLDNSLFYRLKRALYYYSEGAQLANLGLDHNKASYVQDIFINNYRQHEHGCRDHRPSHWRTYR